MMTRSAWIGLIIGIAALGGAYWYLYIKPQQEQEEEVSIPRVSPILEEEPNAEVLEPEIEPPPPIEHPIEEVIDPEAEPKDEKKKLPRLEKSDDSVLSRMRDLFGAQPINAYFIPKELVRRAVLTVDSLDRGPLPLWLRPIRRVTGLFLVDGSGDDLRVSPRNEQRYGALIQMLQRADMARVAAAYKQYYPLFQDAYDGIGNPRSRYFNDRLVEIIDHLLATPVVDGPIKLVRPKVIYLYANPDLEDLSSGRKVLIRMGRKNAEKVKAKLRAFRAEIVKAPALTGE